MTRHFYFRDSGPDGDDLFGVLFFILIVIIVAVAVMVGSPESDVLNNF